MQIDEANNWPSDSCPICNATLGLRGYWLRSQGLTKQEIHEVHKFPSSGIQDDQRYIEQIEQGNSMV